MVKESGDEGNRTPDLLNAIQALYQLSYVPVRFRLSALASTRNVRTIISGLKRLVNLPSDAPLEL